jgi:hypothetical protein
MRRPIVAAQSGARLVARRRNALQRKSVSQKSGKLASVIEMPIGRHVGQHAVNEMRRAFKRKSKSAVVLRRKNVALQGRLGKKSVSARRSKPVRTRRLEPQRKSGELVAANARRSGR